MKRIIFTLFVVIIGSGLVYAASEAKQKAKITIKMATLQPRGSAAMKVMDQLKNEVRDQTGNEVDLKFYWGGVQGDEKDVIRKIRLRQLHGGVFTGIGLTKIVPEVSVTEIPYMFRNRDEVSYVRAELKDAMNKYFEDAGYVVLGWGEVGFVYNFSKVPITSVEVLRKQKCWVWGDDSLGNAVFKALGVSPVPLSFQDVLTSLSANLIDSAATTPFGAVAFRWHTRFEYMNEFPVVNIVGAMVVTKEIWNKISHESQKKILNISSRYHDVLVNTSREENDKSMELIKKSGISIVHSEDPEVTLKFLMDAGKTARENLIGELYSRELLERTLSILDEYRKSHPTSTYMRLE
jgi:TRAP-type C4-dicarboxylate transport system substrate-binding protein